MAFSRGGGGFVSAPRTLTVAVSVLLVALGLLSMTSHLPSALAVVRPHRLLVFAAGYAVLLAGVLLRGL